MNLEGLSHLQKDQLLQFFFHYMPMEMRQRLMATLPRAYNAAVGQKVVEVVNLSFQQAVTVPLDGSEAQANQKQ